MIEIVIIVKRIHGSSSSSHEKSDGIQSGAACVRELIFMRALKSELVNIYKYIIHLKLR